MGLGAHTVAVCSVLCFVTVTCLIVCFWFELQIAVCLVMCLITVAVCLFLCFVFVLNFLLGSVHYGLRTSFFLSVGQHLFDESLWVLVVMFIERAVEILKKC